MILLSWTGCRTGLSRADILSIGKDVPALNILKMLKGDVKVYLKMLQKRRSIRKYQDKEVSGEQIQALLQAALLSPSSRGQRPWQFVLIDQEEILEELAEAKAGGSSFLAGAEIAVAVAADPEVSDVWVEDCSIAATHIQMMAEDLGLGSCWIQIRRRQRQDGIDSENYVRDVLDLPDKLRVLAIVALGYPDEEKPSYELDELNYDRVHYNSYGQEIPN